MANIVKIEDRNTVEIVKALFPQLANVSELEVAKAISLAKEMGLNPLKREVHFVPFKNSIQLVVNYTEYIKRAELTNKLDGWRVDVDEKGESATIVIYRKDFSQPFIWTVYKSEVYQDTYAWKKMPRFMLKKVAIAQGFRLAFPEVASLPYEESELEIELGIEEGMHTDRVITDKQRKRLFAIAREHRVSDDEIKKIIKQYGYESTKDIRVEDYDSIIADIEAQSEKEPDWSEYEEQS